MRESRSSRARDQEGYRATVRHENIDPGAQPSPELLGHDIESDLALIGPRPGRVFDLIQDIGVKEAGRL